MVKLEMQRQHKLSYGRVGPGMTSGVKPPRVGSRVDQYQQLVLPNLSGGDESYKTIDVQAMYDRAKSVDPRKGKLPPK